MPWVVTHTGNTMKFVDGANVYEFLPFNIVNIEIAKDDLNTVVVAVDDKNGHRSIRLEYTDVATPAATTALDLKSKLIGMWVENEKPRKVDEVSDTLSYVGYADEGEATSDPVWAIMKVETVGTVTTISWATARKLRTNIWDNRAALAYV